MSDTMKLPKVIYEDISFDDFRTYCLKDVVESIPKYHPGDIVECLNAFGQPKQGVVIGYEPRVKGWWYHIMFVISDGTRCRSGEAEHELKLIDGVKYAE